MCMTHTGWFAKSQAQEAYILNQLGTRREYPEEYMCMTYTGWFAKSQAQEAYKLNQLGTLRGYIYIMW